jgi:molybdopterin converting factor small subunit
LNEGKSFYLREMREMRVTIEIAGLPLYKTFGKSKKIEFEFPGKTLKELIDALVRKFGFEIKRFLLDKNGDIDMDIRILLNGATYLSENRMQTSLNEGDTLVFKAPS